MPSFTKTQVAALYNEHGSLREMAKILETNPKSLARFMREHDIQYERRVRKYDLNHAFFAEIGEGQLYWAGFIAANANISTARSYRLEMNIALQDRTHLEKMAHDLGSEAPVKDFSTVRPNGEINEHVRTLIMSKEMIADLETHYEITPRKKMSYAMPEWLLVHPGVRHFIRGWTDGIGGFYFHHDQVYFTTRATRLMISQIVKILRREIKLPDDSFYVKDVDSGPLQQLRISGRNVLESLFEFLYADASFFMERKQSEALYLKV